MEPSILIAAGARPTIRGFSGMTNEWRAGRDAMQFGRLTWLVPNECTEVENLTSRGSPGTSRNV